MYEAWSHRSAYGSNLSATPIICGQLDAHPDFREANFEIMTHEGKYNAPLGATPIFAEK